jgi:uncharacterized membrane protein
MIMDIIKRLQNKAFVAALFALIAITGKTFGLYEVPDNLDNRVNAVLVMMTAAGVFLDPTTPGLFDKK